MRKSHKPIRMCVMCKTRLFQYELVRFASLDGKVVKNHKNSRSFYLCQKCLQKDEKILRKALARFGADLKEIFDA